MIQSFRDKDALLTETDEWLAELRRNGRKSNTVMTLTGTR